MSASALPLYRQSFDWEQYCRDYPMPDVFEQTVYRWPRERLRALQNERFMRCVQAGWKNPFYRRRWWRSIRRWCAPSSPKQPPNQRASSKKPRI